MDALRNLTPATQREQARPDQVKNNAGGFVFTIEPMDRALRFLILGTDGGTYYQSERDITRENVSLITSLANDESTANSLLELVLDVSLRGRAPRQNPTLYTLAALCSSTVLPVRQRALEAIPRICRTGTMLFLFAEYVETMRGWGRGLRKAVAKYYESRDARELAYQVTKYNQREGWSQRDLLRLAHPAEIAPDHKTVYQYILGNRQEYTLPRALMLPDPDKAWWFLAALEEAKQTTSPKRWAELASTYRLSWEHLPDAAQREPLVWKALLPSLGLTALVRKLGLLSEIGFARPLSAGSQAIVKRLSDAEDIKRSRIHPLQVLLASTTYGSGHGFRSTKTWTVDQSIVAALDRLFYASFGNVQPAGKRTLVALDVSASMSQVINNTNLSCCMAGTAMGMVALRTEPDAMICAFNHGFTPLPITKATALRDALRHTERVNFGGTDCALPMLWAKENRVEADTFVIITDNETWAGRVHPYQALRDYRQAVGIPARLAVFGMTSTGFTIADPADAGMMDFVGFDAAAPSVLTEFSAGRL